MKDLFYRPLDKVYWGYRILDWIFYKDYMLKMRKCMVRMGLWIICVVLLVDGGVAHSPDRK